MIFENLKALESAATPGPWHVRPLDEDPFGTIRSTHPGEDGKASFVGRMEGPTSGMEDAKLTALLRTLAPQLIHLWEAAERLRTGDKAMSYLNAMKVIESVCMLNENSRQFFEYWIVNSGYGECLICGKDHFKFQNPEHPEGFTDGDDVICICGAKGILSCEGDSDPYVIWH